MDNENKVEIVEEENNTTDTQDLLVPVEDNDYPTEDDSNAGKLGLAIMGLGGLAVAGGVVALIKKCKKPKAESENAEEKPAKPEKQKKQKIKKVRGAKLTLHEKLTGYRDEDPPDEEIEDESTEEG